MIRYVTRGALSGGIRVVDGEYTENNRYFKNDRIFVSSAEAFETLEAAVIKAKQMAKKRAALLYSTADRLSDPTWEPKVAS